jgi:hypothetical protein
MAKSHPSGHSIPVVLATVWEGGMRKSYVAQAHRTGIVALPLSRAPFRPSFFMPLDLLFLCF